MADWPVIPNDWLVAHSEWLIIRRYSGVAYSLLEVRLTLVHSQSKHRAYDSFSAKTVRLSTKTGWLHVTSRLARIEAVGPQKWNHGYLMLLGVVDCSGMVISDHCWSTKCSNTLFDGIDITCGTIMTVGGFHELQCGGAYY